MQQNTLRWFHPVLPARALKARPRRVLLGGRAWALFRGVDGRPAAVADRCAHRFAPLSDGRVAADGRLACPYHGWRYDGAGRGESATQAGLGCKVDALQVVERHGWLWLARHDADAATFPEVGEAGYVPAGGFSVRFDAPLALVLDNFGEDEHLPWVHTRLGWDAAHLGEVVHETRTFPDRTEVAWRGPQRRSLLVHLLLLRPGDRFENEWVHRFDPVRASYRMSWRAPDGRVRPFRTRVDIFFVPESPETTRVTVFPHVRIEPPFLRVLLPLVTRATRFLGFLEARDDARFLARMHGVPASLEGARLGRFDQALVHNRALLRRLYEEAG
ncbi:MAG: Rieske 2Fe-2S domain-containing protein [Myxococcota bacterium]